MIEIEGLVRRFGDLTAVGGISLRVGKGEVLGFLGPNGAGKSTTMKMITGFIAPSEGRISVCGHDVVEEPFLAQSAIGYLPEGAPAYPDMTPVQFLGFIAQVRGLKTKPRKKRSNSLSPAPAFKVCWISGSKRYRRVSNAASVWRRPSSTIRRSSSWTNPPPVSIPIKSRPCAA